MDTKDVKFIILPGWGGSSETWSEFISIAKKKYSISCINLPCFGNEPCPNDVWGVNEYAEFVKSKLGANEQKIVLVGHSFGGQVAAYLTANNPRLVSLLILVAPAVFRPKNLYRRSFFGLAAFIGKWLFKFRILKKFSVVAKNHFYKLIDARDYNNSIGIKQEIFKKVIREDLTQSLKGISCPTLILWGTADAYTPIKFADKLSNMIKGAEMHIFKNGRHGLHLERPEELFIKIDSFVQKNSV